MTPAARAAVQFWNTRAPVLGVVVAGAVVVGPVVSLTVGEEPGEGSRIVGQPSRTVRIATCSAPVTDTPYLSLTATWRATYAQRKRLFGGSQVAASPSPF